MADDDKPPVDDADKGTQTPPAGSGDAGQGQGSEAPLQVPDKFKGKSPEEIAKAYVELEKKLGEQSTTVAEAKKLQEQTDTLLRAVWADPDLYRQVEEGVRKYMAGDKVPDTRSKDGKPNEKKGDEEAPADVKLSSDLLDMRKAQEERILQDFYGKYGYNNLDEKAKKDSFTRLAMGLAELVDPGGTKSVKQIMSEIPLAKLPRFLENAHRLANFETIVSEAKNSARLEDRENDGATIGSFAAASSNSRGNGVALSNSERAVAQKMGISEETYAKRKAQIDKENKTIS